MHEDPSDCQYDPWLAWSYAPLVLRSDLWLLAHDIGEYLQLVLHGFAEAAATLAQEVQP